MTLTEKQIKSMDAIWGQGSFCSRLFLKICDLMEITGEEFTWNGIFNNVMWNINKDGYDKLLKELSTRSKGVHPDNSIRYVISAYVDDFAWLLVDCK